MRALVALVGFTALAAGQPFSRSSGVLFGRYEGMVPCADCGGIRTELVLYAQSPNGPPTTCEIRETYLATRDGDRSTTSTGRWTILRGSAADPDATVYQLDLDKPEQVRSYRRVSEDELRLLDRRQREISSSRHYSLFKRDAPGPVVVSDADSGRRLELEVGQLLVVRLTASRSTGSSWTHRAGAGSALEPQGEPDYVPNPGMGVMGAAGVEIFRFKAVRPGLQTLVFDYARHGQRDQPPMRTVSFEASVR